MQRINNNNAAESITAGSVMADPLRPDPLRPGPLRRIHHGRIHHVGIHHGGSITAGSVTADPSRPDPSRPDPLWRIHYGRIRCMQRIYNKSGRRSSVRLTAWSSRHCSINLKFPFNKTSGTFNPLNSAGLVYTGGASKPSW